jgi:hypothetical protein
MVSVDVALDKQATALLDELERENAAEDTCRSVEFTNPREVFRGIVPEEVIKFVEGIARTKEVQLLVLERVHEVVSRRLPTGIAPAEAARERWERAWRSKPEQLRQRLGRARDEVVRVAHLGSAAAPSRLTALPRKVVFATPNENGEIWVRDRSSPLGDLGHGAFLEPTPSEVVRVAHKAWESRNATHRAPVFWDTTAGSGTVGDYFSLLGRGRGISSDLTVVRDVVVCKAVQRVRRLVQGKLSSFVANDQFEVVRPDLIFFDPPSIGTPTHSQMYLGDEPQLDFACLSQAEWISAVGSIARTCVGRLSKDGMLSLLVRAGRRSGSKVEPLPEMTEALLVFLESREVDLPKIEVLARNEVKFALRRINQAGLGQSRVPATHLLLGRAS